MIYIFLPISQIHRIIFFTWIAYNTVDDITMAQYCIPVFICKLLWRSCTGLFTYIPNTLSLRGSNDHCKIPTAPPGGTLIISQPFQPKYNVHSRTPTHSKLLNPNNIQCQSRTKKETVSGRHWLVNFPVKNWQDCVVFVDLCVISCLISEIRARISQPRSHGFRLREQEKKKNGAARSISFRNGVDDFPIWRTVLFKKGVVTKIWRGKSTPHISFYPFNNPKSLNLLQNNYFGGILVGAGTTNELTLKRISQLTSYVMKLVVLSHRRKQATNGQSRAM